MNGEQRPGWYFERAQDDLNLRILSMFEGTFSLDAALMYKVGFHIRSRKPYFKDTLLREITSKRFASSEKSSV